MQFIAGAQKKRTIVCAIVRLLLAAVSPNEKIHRTNNGEQNVSFDRSTPGLAGDCKRFRVFFRLLHNATEHLDQHMKGKITVK
jgi:hypothetical protein